MSSLSAVCCLRRHHSGPGKGILKAHPTESPARAAIVGIFRYLAQGNPVTPVTSLLHRTTSCWRLVDPTAVSLLPACSAAVRFLGSVWCNRTAFSSLHANSSSLGQASVRNHGTSKQLSQLISACGFQDLFCCSPKSLTSEIELIRCTSQLHTRIKVQPAHLCYSLLCPRKRGTNCDKCQANGGRC